MKNNIHPIYDSVIFVDPTTGFKLETRSTLAGSLPSENGTIPTITVDVTSDSHPFWTGAKNTRDAEGRVAAFNRRYGK